MDFFGLDIGSEILKMAQVEKRGKKNRLVAIASASSPPRGLLSEAETDLTTLAQAIKKLRDEAKIKTRNVVVALPEDKVFSKVVTFPKLSEKELKAAIKWEAEQYVPIPLEEVTLDHQVLGMSRQGSIDKMEVFLVAAPKRLIDKLIRVLTVAGLEPISLETEILALTRGLTTPAMEACLLVDLGARASDMAVVEKGQLVFTRSIPTGGEALTRAVAGGLELESAQAEEYKKAYGVDPQKLEGKISAVLGPIFDSVVVEMEKVIQFYQSSKQKTVKRVILSGGTASLPGLVPHLAQKLGLEIQIADPFAGLEKSDEILKKIPAGTAPLYSTVVGLALKDVE
jgi:type IV pilus assembly protein PilM